MRAERGDEKGGEGVESKIGTRKKKEGRGTEGNEERRKKEVSE